MRRLLLLPLLAIPLLVLSCDETPTQPDEATAKTGQETNPSFAKTISGKANIGWEVVVNQTNWPTPVAMPPDAARAHIGAVVACPEGKVPLGGGGWVTGTAGGWYMVNSQPVWPDTPICPGEPDRYCAWAVTWESETGDPDNPNASGVGAIAFVICAAVK